MKPPDPGESATFLSPYDWEHELRAVQNQAGSAVTTMDSPVGHKILRPPTSSSPSSLRALTQTPDTLSDPFGSIRTRHLPANAGHNNA